jgi:hypothetical protein
MKANELRIGDLVRLFLGVDDNGPNYREYKISGIMTDSIGSSHYLVGNMWIEISNNLEPIPLTEEWLIRLGFEKTFITKIHLTFSKGPFSLLKRDKHIQIWYENINVQYVHQLQLLYFALTNEELI